MNKLLIATAAVCMAVVTQAAVANWKVAAANIYDGTGSTGSKYAGTAYFFDSEKQTQASLYTLICGADSSFDATKLTGYVASGTVSAGTISSSTTSFSYGTQSASSTDKNYYSYYFVLIEDGKAFFSAEKSAAANATDTATIISYGSLASGSQAAPSSTGFAGAGAWSSTASIPEPTSAMLLMLGLCGLALKRKNA